MPFEKHMPEEIIGKPGEVEIVLAQGHTRHNDPEVFFRAVVRGSRHRLVVISQP